MNKYIYITVDWDQVTQVDSSACWAYPKAAAVRDEAPVDTIKENKRLCNKINP